DLCRHVLPPHRLCRTRGRDHLREGALDRHARFSRPGTLRPRQHHLLNPHFPPPLGEGRGGGRLLTFCCSFLGLRLWLPLCLVARLLFEQVFVLVLVFLFVVVLQLFLVYDGLVDELVLPLCPH